MYQAQAPGGVINQFVVPEPIRVKPRPVDIRPRLDPGLIARTETLDRVVAAIAAGPVQIVAGDGWGKTTLLAQVAREDSVEAPRDGIAVVSAWGLGVEDVEQAVFEAFFECTLPDTRLKATPGQLRTSFADIVATLIVDDLDIARQLVDRVMDACPRCTFISTAAASTMLSGGTIVDLPPLEGDDVAYLFAQRLGRSLSTAEREMVIRFGAAASGHPLSIVTAASTVRRGGAKIDELVRLAGASDPLSAIGESLAQAFSLSEKRVLSTLAAVGGAPLPAKAVGAASGVDAPTETLERLKRDGVVLTASPVFRLPSVLAAVLDLPDTRAATTAGLTQWAHDEAQVDAVASSGTAIEALMRSAVARGEFEPAMALGRSADAGLALSGRWELWGSVVEQVGVAAANARNPFERAWALHQRGTRSLLEGATEPGRELLTEAAGIREQIGDVAGLEVTRHNLGAVTPPPPDVTPEPGAETPPPPPSGGMPFWVWSLIAVTVIAVAVVIAVYINRNGPDPPPGVVTTVPEQGELYPGRDSIEFGEVAPGNDAAAELELTNTGPGPLEIEGVRIEGHDWFAIHADCGSLDPNTSCLVEVIFAPPEPGEARGEVVVTHTGGNDDVVVTVFGTSTEPPEAYVVVDPVVVDFGVVPRADRRLSDAGNALEEWTREVTVTNEGDLDVHIDSIFIESEGFRHGGDCPPLGPGDTCTIPVQILAFEPGVYQAVLFIEHNAQNPNFEIPLSGLVPTPPNLTVSIVEATTAEELNEAGDTAYWVAPVRLEATNSGEETVRERFEVLVQVRTSDDVILWDDATTPDGAPARFTVDTPIGPGETIAIKVDLGFDARWHLPGAWETIRAHVDSCMDELSRPLVPCQIVESDEDDNFSEEHEFEVVGRIIWEDLRLDLRDLITIVTEDTTEVVD